LLIQLIASWNRRGFANPGLAEVNNGRAGAWNMVGDLAKATLFEEKAIAIAPQTANYWNQLAQLYDRQGRETDAQKARDQAAGLAGGQGP